MRIVTEPDLRVLPIHCSADPDIALLLQRHDDAVFAMIGHRPTNFFEGGGQKPRGFTRDPTAPDCELRQLPCVPRLPLGPRDQTAAVPLRQANGNGRVTQACGCVRVVLPLRGQPGDRRRGQAGVGAEEAFQRRGEVLAGQAVQVQQRQHLVDLR